MKQTIDTEYTGNVKPAERLVRVVLGLAFIITSLNTAITDNVAMSYPILIGSIIVLTGIAAWDPIYALLRAFLAKSSSEKSPFMDELPANA